MIAARHARPRSPRACRQRGNVVPLGMIVASWMAMFACSATAFRFASLPVCPSQRGSSCTATCRVFGYTGEGLPRGTAAAAAASRRATRRRGGLSLARPFSGRGGAAAAAGAASPMTMSTSLETNLGEIFKVPDERILKAVEKAGNRAVPSDIATLAGVDLNFAKRGLVYLATLVDGDLEVSKDGDVVYNFPSNFRGTLLQRSAYRRAVETVRGAWPLIFYGVRVTFGVALFASIALIFSTIVVASTATSSEGDNNRGRGRSRGFDDRGFGGGGGGGGMGMYFGPSPFDFFFYRPYYGYYNTPVQARRDPEEMGIFESVFSYIFGDGNPNSDIGQRRVEAAAKLIRANGGAVTADQLAPLLSPAGGPRPDYGGIVDESFVLPVLTALDGSPEVTDDGDIVYVFPSLQTSAIGVGGSTGMDAVDYEALARRNGLKSLSTADLRASLDAVGVRTSAMFERSELVEAAMQSGIEKLPDGQVVLRERSSSRASAKGSSARSGTLDLAEPLQEARREFSVAGGVMKFVAAGLGVLNLGGALYLQTILSDPQFGGVVLPGIFGFVQGAMPFLLTYAVAFNVIPLVRWLVNKRENAAINARNSARQQWAARLKNGGPAVDRKLKAAKNMARSLNVIKSKDVEYTTAKSISEQGVDDNLLDDFDMRLEKMEDKKQIDG